MGAGICVLVVSAALVAAIVAALAGAALDLGLRTLGREELQDAYTPLFVVGLILLLPLFLGAQLQQVIREPWPPEDPKPSRPFRSLAAEVLGLVVLVAFVLAVAVSMWKSSGG